MLYFSDRRNLPNRWAALFVLGASIGALGYVIKDTVIPWTMESQLINEFLDSIWIVQKMMLVGSNYLCPFGMLLFSLTYAQWINTKKKHRTTIAILLIPIMAMAYNTSFEKAEPFSFVWLFTWAGPYFFGACIILIISYWKETNLNQKRNRRNMAIILIPPTIATLLLNNILRIFYGELELFRYLPVFAVIAFVVYGIFLYLDGVLGIRIRIERQTISNQLKAISMSSSMLNHAIRNRLAIMDLSLEHIHSESIQNKCSSIEQYADVAMTELKQMLAMIERIQKQLNDVTVELKPIRIIELINYVVDGFMKLPGSNKIVVHYEYSIDPIILCDQVHISETLLNLMKNASEAMGPNGGSIRISMNIERKQLVIKVSDNGPGIREEDVSKLFEPFFSTKKRNANFGLGLTYCYLVVQAHRGKLEVESELGTGTTFSIRFTQKLNLNDDRIRSIESERGVGQVGIN